jgi:hypothetical protein
MAAIAIWYRAASPTTRRRSRFREAVYAEGLQN